jgi:hypothetical protein
VFVYANTYSVSESLEVGDNISFNISGTTYRRSILDVTGNVVKLNTTTGLVTSDVVMFIKTPVYNVVSYTIIRANG